MQSGVANMQNSGDKPIDPAVAWHQKLVQRARSKVTSSKSERRSIDEEAASDRARIIYSSAFRRLQQKTQVFTLSKDAAVRSRLTHSLEVASTGRWIAQKVVDKLLGLGLEPMVGSAIVSLVETGCLAHDIGNPPFGHFGEAAIREWFDNWQDVAGKDHAKDPKLQELVKDFLQFDGNPQGMRILTRLQGRTKGEREEWGMHLTFSQILTALKYPRGPVDGSGVWKKAGFFESERPKIEEAWRTFGFDPKEQRRFPLAYLVEAADDISYCISDMEDGIDQGLLTPRQFFEEIRGWIQEPNSSALLEELRKSASGYCSEVLKTSDSDKAKDQFAMFKTDFGGTMIDEAARLYGDGSSADIVKGTRRGLLDQSDADRLLEILKGVARKLLYPAERVQKPFLAGLKITHGILEAYGRILNLTQERFPYFGRHGARISVKKRSTRA